MGNFYYPRIYKVNKFPVLNYLKYNKNAAKKLIMKELGWRDYGVKHGESKFTKLFQSYILLKCGYDKRRAHLSSLVLANEITRAQALKEIKTSVYKDQKELKRDINFVSKKLKITTEEFERLIADPFIHFSKYPNSQKILSF